MALYHPAKIKHVFQTKGKNVESADSTVQAAVKMWDGNLVTTTVAPKLAAKAKAGDIVLVDYSPTSARLPIPKLTVTKILRGEAAKQLWAEYRTYLEKRKPARPTATTLPGKQSYG